MITLLRRIRKSLIGSGNAGKPASPGARYLLYAIGEILLVMIGILLALQVNNWNEGRKLHIEETKLLKSIQEQFTYNLNELERAISTSHMVQDKCIQLLDNMGNKGVRLSRYEADSLVFTGLRRIVTYDVSNGILNDMINSGRLHIIRNDSLRNKLANWSSALVDVKEDEKWAVEIRNDQTLPFIRQHYTTNSSFRLGIASGFEWDYKRVFNMQEFENLVDQHRHLNGSNEFNYRNLKEYIEEILSLCSKELKERTGI